jgi:integrase
VTKKGDTIGQRPIKAITPVSADRIYQLVCDGPRGPRPRQGEKVVALCRTAWRVVRRLYPDQFNTDVPNPWDGVTKKKRTMKTKPAATREEVYAFAKGAIELGHPEAAAAAVVCFEWLQRPENVLGGYVTWSDYRSKDHPNAIKILHHKTGAVVWHPLEETTEAGAVRFYEEAEAVLARAPRRGVPMILKPARADDPAEPYTAMTMAKVVVKIRGTLGLPSTFTLDACRHGGMTELEEAELTDGQGRALSGHRSQRAYEGYAKRTLARALPATRKRYAHKLANVTGTDFRNEERIPFRNDGPDEQNEIA